jgi:hypothetical protein
MNTNKYKSIAEYAKLLNERDMTAIILLIDFMLLISLATLSTLNVLKVLTDFKALRLLLELLEKITSTKLSMTTVPSR